MALSFLNAGEIKIISLITANSQLKKYLESLGFQIGEEVKVISNSTNGLIVSIKNTTLALDKATANTILVR